MGFNSATVKLLLGSLRGQINTLNVSEQQIKETMQGIVVSLESELFPSTTQPVITDVRNTVNEIIDNNVEAEQTDSLKDDRIGKKVTADFEIYYTSEWESVHIILFLEHFMNRVEKCTAKQQRDFWSHLSAMYYVTTIDVIMAYPNKPWRGKYFIENFGVNMRTVLTYPVQKWWWEYVVAWDEKYNADGSFITYKMVEEHTDRI